MAYFPFFMELEGKQGLVVGGGTVALRKLQKLLRVPVQLLQLTDGLCHRPDLEKMVNVMNTALIKFDHLLCHSCNDHSFSSLKAPYLSSARKIRSYRRVPAPKALPSVRCRRHSP